MSYIFWGCLALVAFAYLGYPMIMLGRAALFPKPLSAREGMAPSAVSIVLAVRNGDQWLHRRIQNLVEQEYPSEQWEILVVCNGCNDNSEGIVERWATSDSRVHLLLSDASEGKAGALNVGVEAAKHSLIVFADVRQRFQDGAIRELTGPFADPDVGAVTGRLVVRRSNRPAVEGFGRYWELETRLRMAESETGSVIGATGAIYAIRKDLYQPVPSGTLLDDVFTPLRIALAGKRVYMAREAVAHDTPSTSERAEYRRRVRTLAGNLQLVKLLPGVVSPFRGLSWRFFFHKLLRVLTPLLFLGLLIGGILTPGMLYKAVAGALLLLYLGGFVGLVVRHRALALPAAFLLIQIAGLEAMLRTRRTADRLWTM